MQTTDRDLENEIRVLTGTRAETGSVMVAVNVSIGSLDELRPEQHGAAHFLEHMALKGTKTRDRLAIVREVEGRGGTINAQTSHDGTMYWILTTPRHFQHAADILHDIVFNSILPEDEFAKEQKVVLEELKQMPDNWVYVIWKEFDKVMFDGTTRAHPIIGNKDSVADMTRDKLLDFKRAYLNDVIAVVAVGPVPDAEERLVDLFSPVPSTSRNVVESRQATLRENRQVQVPSKFEQCYQFVGMDGLNDRTLFRTPAANIVASMLGGGMSSLLFQRIREELGLAYQVGSFLDANLHNGTFVAYAITDPKNADQAAEETLNVMRKVASGDFADDDLEEAKERVIGPMYTHSETNAAMANKLLFSSIATGSYISLEERETNFRSVTKDHVANLVSDLLDRPTLQLQLVPQEE